MKRFVSEEGMRVLWEKVKTYVSGASVTGNAGTATRLQAARSIDGVNFDGAAARHHHTTCSTAAATVAKIVSLTGFTLVTGAKITVLFSYGISCDNATLNVASTGAKPIYYRGSSLQGNHIKAGDLVELVYTGSWWRIVGEYSKKNVDSIGVEVYRDESVGGGVTWTAGSEKIVATITVEAGAYLIDCTNTSLFSGAMINGTAKCVAWMKLSNAGNTDFHKYRTFDYSGHAQLISYLDAGTYSIVLGMDVNRTGTPPGRFGGLFVTRIG